MKRALLIIILTVTVNLSYGSVSDVFKVDKNSITSEMKELDALEHFVISNPGLSLTEIQLSHPMLTSNILKQEENPFSQLSLLTNSSYTTRNEGCIWILACTCCVSTSVGLIFYYIEYMATII